MTEQYKILLVDDCQDINNVIYDILISEGYSCTQVFDGIQATALLEKKDFDLLITDFKMPNMNGVELLDWCRENKKHFPVIIMTANVNQLPEVLVNLNDCCTAVIKKPMELEEILKAVEDAKERNHQLECKIKEEN